MSRKIKYLNLKKSLTCGYRVVNCFFWFFDRFQKRSLSFRERKQSFLKITFRKRSFFKNNAFKKKISLKNRFLKMKVIRCMLSCLYVLGGVGFVG